MSGQFYEMVLILKLKIPKFRIVVRRDLGENPFPVTGFLIPKNIMGPDLFRGPLSL